ncbi:MAG: ATP-binding protein [Candidatus Diapherotrites archaeon]|uniref:ATP-binding protein n=1 Tax=Candidatus Iainarchaeum sp. TaxID=3101447 RepID=A0A8T4C6B9_9ARCH|nr:ATP-binding protein [Candidatus Diapherotrites archaeon]
MSEEKKPRVHVEKGHQDPFDKIMQDVEREGDAEEKGEETPPNNDEEKRTNLDDDLSADTEENSRMIPLRKKKGRATSESEEEMETHSHEDTRASAHSSSVEEGEMPPMDEDDFLFEHGIQEEGIHSEGVSAKHTLVERPPIEPVEGVDEHAVSREQIKQNILLKTRGHALEEPASVLKLSLLEDEKKKAIFIGRKRSVMQKSGLDGALYVGKVQDDERYRAFKLYVDSLNPHVIFTCGSRGSGKSYLLGVLAEELALHNTNVGIVVVDPVGVFWSMRYPNKEEKEVKELPHYELMPQGLENMRVFIPEGMKSETPRSTYDALFSVPPSLLTSEDWCLTFGIERFSPTGLLLEKALKKLEKGYRSTGGETIKGKKDAYTLNELVACLENDTELNSKEKGYKTDSVRALVSRFEAAKGWGIFSDKGTPLSEISRAGQLTVIDTSFLDDTVTALVIGILARRLLAARKIQTRKEAANEPMEKSVESLMENEIPPTWLFIDEAHTLIPGGNVSTPATTAIVEYVKQGRRPGCSLVFATQQPSAIDTRVLSQLDIILSHKLIFDDDIKAVTKRTPTIIPMKYKHPHFLKTLPVGTALVGDRREETNRAFVLKIRPRMSQHEGRDAETGERKKSMSEKEARMLCVSLLMSKLEKEGMLDKETIEQVMGMLNQKYGQKMLLSSILDEMEARGARIDPKTEAVKSPNFVEVISKKEKDKHTQPLPEAELAAVQKVENLAKLVELPSINEDTDLSAFPVPYSREEIVQRFLKASKKTLLGIGKPAEQLKEVTLSYVPIWKVQYRQFTGKTSYVVRECFIDAEKGEFLHYLNNQFVTSNGLQALAGLSTNDQHVLRMIRMGGQTIANLQKKTGLDEKTVKRSLVKLRDRGMIRVLNENTLPTFVIAKDLDIPFSGGEKQLSSLQALKLVHVTNIAKSIPKYSEEQLHALLTNLWPNVVVNTVKEIYRPLFEGLLINTKTGEHRIVKMDGYTGTILNE